MNIFLTLLLIAMLTVFSVDVRQKRREYLLKMRERGWVGRKETLTTFRHKPRLAVRPPYLAKANDEGGYDIVKRYWKGGKVVEEMHMKHAVRKRERRLPRKVVEEMQRRKRI